MSNSSYNSLIATGETLTVTSPYVVPTSLTFENKGTVEGVVLFTRAGLVAGTADINGTIMPVASFGGGSIANMLPGAYPGIAGDEIVIQSIDSLFSTLDVASTAAADNSSFGYQATFAALSGDHAYIVNGTVEMSANTPFTLNANEKLVIDEIALGLFGTAANGATLDIAFATRENPAANPNNPFIDAVVTAYSEVNPCFAEGTLILTTRGEIRVEALRAGDRVITPEGGEAEIVWIGRRAVTLEGAARAEALRPVIIEPGALAEGVPSRRLCLSPDHALYLEGVLVPAKMLINWNSIRQDQSVSRVVYYHIELPAHGALFAEGCAVESFLDTGHRSMFDNADKTMAVLPAVMQQRREIESFAPLCLDGEGLAQIRARIAARQPGLKLA